VQKPRPRAGAFCFGKLASSCAGVNDAALLALFFLIPWPGTQSWVRRQQARPMKKSSLLASMLFAVAVLFAVAAAPVALAGDQDFTVVNQTGIEIHELYVTPHDSDDWEDDILGEDTLPNGSEVDIKCSRKEKAKLWDLKVVDADGNSVEWENLDLLDISEVTLHYKKGKAWADVK